MFLYLDWSNAVKTFGSILLNRARPEIPSPGRTCIADLPHLNSQYNDDQHPQSEH